MSHYVWIAGADRRKSFVLNRLGAFMCCYQNFSSFVCFVFGMIVVIFAVCLSFSVWWSAHARGFLFLKLGVILTVGQPSHYPVCIPCTNLSFLSLQSAAFFSHLLTTLECTDLPFRLTSEWPLTKDMMFGVWSKFWNWILINLWYDLFVWNVWEWIFVWNANNLVSFFPKAAKIPASTVDLCWPLNLHDLSS